MSKTKQSKTTPAPRGTAKAKSGKTAAKAGQTAKAPKRETKQDRILKMLRSKSGATVPAMAEAVGWQEHSVRGFMSATVQKKLGYELTAEGTGAKRRYRIVEKESAKKKGGSS